MMKKKSRKKTASTRSTHFHFHFIDDTRAKKSPPERKSQSESSYDDLIIHDSISTGTEDAEPFSFEDRRKNPKIMRTHTGDSSPFSSPKLNTTNRLDVIKPGHDEVDRNQRFAKLSKSSDLVPSRSHTRTNSEKESHARKTTKSVESDSRAKKPKNQIKNIIIPSEESSDTPEVRLDRSPRKKAELPRKNVVIMNRADESPRTSEATRVPLEPKPITRPPAQAQHTFQPLKENLGRKLSTDEDTFSDDDSFSSCQDPHLSKSEDSQSRSQSSEKLKNDLAKRVSTDDHTRTKLQGPDQETEPFSIKPTDPVRVEPKAPDKLCEIWNIQPIRWQQVYDSPKDEKETVRTRDTVALPKSDSRKKAHYDRNKQAASRAKTSLKKESKEKKPQSRSTETSQPRINLIDPTLLDKSISIGTKQTNDQVTLKPFQNNEIYQMFVKLDKNLLKKILLGFYRLVRTHQKLLPQFQARLASLLGGSMDETDLFMLNELLISQNRLERKNGTNFLFQLKLATMLTPERYADPLKEATESIFYGLLQHINPTVRKQYLFISEKIGLALLECSGKAASLSSLNSHIMELILRKEKNEDMLVTAFYIIFHFVKIPTEAVADNKDDFHDLCGEFLSGSTAIGRNFISFFSIDIFVYLFETLPIRLSKIRITLQSIIITHLREDPEALSVVGSNFFKLQVEAKDPYIACAAANFLIEILQKQNPERFTQVMNALLEKAVSNNDEQLIFNPYLQIKSILEFEGIAF